MHGIVTTLDVRGVTALVVGGGTVGTRRATRLAAAGASVRVVDPASRPGEPVAGGTGADPARGGIEHLARAFEPADLAGVRLVVVATADPVANRQVAEAVAALPEPRPWINRADEASAGDLGFMATANAGSLTVAVDSGGASAAEAKRLAVELAARLDPDRARLLAAVAAVRPRVRALVDDPQERGRLLREMTSPDALTLLRDRGAAALDAWLGTLVGEGRTGAGASAGGEDATSASTPEPKP